MRQPAADWKSLLLAMGVDILGDTCVQPSSAVAGAATQADGVMDAIRPGRTMRDLHVWDQQIVTEEIVQKVRWCPIPDALPSSWPHGTSLTRDYNH